MQQEQQQFINQGNFNIQQQSQGSNPYLGGYPAQQQFPPQSPQQQF
jgi:hypothetical protein